MAYLLGQPVRDAWGLWKDALGGGYGQDHGHRLDMEEIKKADGGFQACYTDYKNNQWDSNVPLDTLEIRLGPEYTGIGDRPGQYASLAYVPLPWVTGGMNHMQIYHDTPLQSLAHEIGHVFGLEHEHQCEDRDEHVYWSCEAIRGYQDIQRLLEAEGSEITMNEMCTVKEIYEDYKDDVPEFSPEAFDFHFHVQTGAYDVDSSMHYHSASFAYGSGNCLIGLDVSYCTLLRYTSDERGAEAPMEIIMPAKRPSRMDAEGLKDIYPWEPESEST